MTDETKKAKIMVSANIDMALYNVIKEKKYKIAEVIEFGIHCKQMEINEIKAYKDRLEKLSTMVTQQGKRIWELEGRFIEEIRQSKGDENVQ